MSIPADIQHNVNLAPYTTWQVGGAAQYFLEPKNKEVLREAFCWALENKVNWYVMGRGSNLLVSDEGFRGLVIRLGAAFSQIAIEPDGDNARIRAQAGLPCAQFVVKTNQAGFGGLEPLVGVPGSIGGAVAMNAGAHGVSVSDLMLEGTVLLPSGEMVVWDREEFGFSYRHSRLQGLGGVFIEGVWHLPRVEVPSAKERVRELQRWRHEKQPTNFPSGGSTFRNPDGGHPSAGSLIESVGGKGLREGNAQVSEKHANFIVNCGGAKAVEINALIVTLQQRVYDTYGVRLVPEVMGLGMQVGEL
ncbi:MAG: UDP-N-acetylmuramate dehydrogenase [Candidatus Sericytochromatia bacterium]|nr:UDP-N-acetylmuramate dehydrogenase [Candidatus Sericytochromatia bacterium]